MRFYKEGTRPFQLERYKDCIPDLLDLREDYTDILLSNSFRGCVYSIIVIILSIIIKSMLLNAKKFGCFPTLYKKSKKELL